MIRIVFFAPYPAIFSDIRKVFRARPDRDELEYEVCQDIPDNPLENLNADIIIARGFTAMALEKAGIPCAELTVSGYDVLAAVQKCREMASAAKIAILGPFNMIYGAEQIGKAIPGVTLTTYIFEEEGKREEALKQAVADGNTAVVGTHSCALIAERYNIPAVTIESGRESINNAISHAKAAVLLARKEKEESARYESLLNFSFQGMVAADEAGKITMANNYVYQSLKLEHSLTGTALKDLFPDVPVDAVLKNGARILWDIRKYGALSLVINCVPIPGAGRRRFAGCVLTFQRLGGGRNGEQVLKKKLSRRSYAAQRRLEELRFCSSEAEQLLQDAREYGYTDFPVMIIGEAGTEKEILAHGIHNISRRKSRPFAAVDCAALTEREQELELFGCESGWEGHAEERAGLFELAHQGTIFLENVSALSLRLQEKLLRVLKTRETIRCGGAEAASVNVRVLCSEEPGIREQAAAGRFRKELFYRLDTLELCIPPLRERQSDIPYLISCYVGLERERQGSLLESVSGEAMRWLSEYAWPGNTSELANFCGRLSILCRKKEAGPEDCVRALPELSSIKRMEETEMGSAGQEGTAVLKTDRAKEERERIAEALRVCNFSRKQTAAALGMDPSTLWRKMKKYGL